MGICLFFSFRGFENSLLEGNQKIGKIRENPSSLKKHFVLVGVR